MLSYSRKFLNMSKSDVDYVTLVETHAGVQSTCERFSSRALIGFKHAGVQLSTKQLRIPPDM